MGKVLICLFIFLFSVISASYCDTIRFKNGKIIEATILEKTDRYIKVDFQGIFLKYYFYEISSINGKPVSSEGAAGRSTASNIESSPSSIFEKVAPAVVVINAVLPNGHSQGSGFIVDPSGVIVTNFHVVAGAEEINVRLKDGKQFSVVGIIDYNVEKDICILKIEANNLPTVALGNSNFIEPGSKVFVIGAPLGFDYSITDGLYSSRRDSYSTVYLQFSAPISPGNSGGPLLDSQSKVVGVTTLTRTEGQNVNFAVAINEVKKYIAKFPRMSMEEYAAKISRAYFYYDKAQEAYYLNADWQGAIRYLEQALNNDPNFIDAHIFLAGLYEIEANRVADGIAQLKKALVAAPNNSEVHNELGAMYAAEGMYNLGIEELKKAMSLDPQYISPYINLSACYEKQDRLYESTEILKKALSIDLNDPKVHLNMGWLYHRMGKNSQAVEETQKSIALDPYYALSYHNLSVIYFDMAKYNEAVKYYDEALSLGRPPDSGYLEQLKPYRKDKKSFSPSAWRNEFFSRSVFSDSERQRLRARVNKETDDLLRSAYVAYQQGNYAQSMQYMERALLQAQPGTQEYYYLLEGTTIFYGGAAESYAAKGLVDDAIDYANRALITVGSAPENFNILRAQCYVNLVDFYAKIKNNEKMREYIKKLHALYPEVAYSLAREYALGDMFNK